MTLIPAVGFVVTTALLSVEVFLWLSNPTPLNGACAVFVGGLLGFQALMLARAMNR